MLSLNRTETTIYDNISYKKIDRNKRFFRQYYMKIFLKKICLIGLCLGLSGGLQAAGGDHQLKMHQWILGLLTYYMVPGGNPELTVIQEGDPAAHGGDGIGQGNSPLDEALRAGNFDAIMRLLRLDGEAGDEGNLVRLEDDRGDSHAPLVEITAEAEDPNRVLNEDGETALHLAVNAGDLAEVRRLLDRPGIAIDTRDLNGFTALHVALSRLSLLPSLRSMQAHNSRMDKSIRLHLELVQLMLGKHAELRVGYEQCYESLLALQVELCSNVDCIEIMQEQLNALMTEPVDEIKLASVKEVIEGFTLRNREIADCLEREGLFKECLEKELKAADEMIKSDFLQIERERESVTSDFKRLENELENRRQIVYSLLEAGAKIDLKTNDGRTPLHFAAQGLDLDVVVFLLQKGADPRAINHNGRKPVDGIDASTPEGVSIRWYLNVYESRRNESESDTKE